jgi:peptide/nickel transport system substrate-binding protein
MQGAIAEFWKNVGVRVTFDNVPLNTWNDAQQRATFPGTWLASVATTNVNLTRVWPTQAIPRPESRYVGDNVDGWDNPVKDQALAELGQAFTPPQLETALSRLARLYSDELPSLPMYYKTEAVAIATELKNARPRPNSGGANSTDWDAYLWEWGS